MISCMEAREKCMIIDIMFSLSDVKLPEKRHIYIHLENTHRQANNTQAIHYV